MSWFPPIVSKPSGPQPVNPSVFTAPFLRQLRRFLPLIEQVADREVRMAPNHPRPGKPHDISHPLALLGAITMNRTPGARRFFAAVGAAVEFSIGVIRELTTLPAEVGSTVVPIAVHGHHGAYGEALPLQARRIFLRAHRYRNNRSSNCIAHRPTCLRRPYQLAYAP